MKNTKRLHFALLFARFVLGFYILCAGLAKVRGELTDGFGTFYHSAFFQSVQPAWLPDALAAPFGYLLPWVELMTGLLLILGLYGSVVAVVAALFLLGIMLSFLSSGSLFAFQDAYGSAGPYHANIVFFALALLLAVTGPGRYSLDHHRHKGPS